MTEESLPYAAFLTGTAQPPLPLQEFLPAQPASPVLQPPWPLHEFMPLQECFMSAEAQPPLPLQEFLPAQPASPALQPPLPLQEFFPAQTCLSEAAALSLAFSSPAVVFALPFARGVVAFARPEPASTPAIARPIALVVRSPFFIRFLLSSPPSGGAQVSVQPTWLDRDPRIDRERGPRPRDRARTVAGSYPSRAPAASSPLVFPIRLPSREGYADGP